ncbi:MULTISPECIES: DUF2025 family protein [unclassified Pseudomonas]|uniref:DUF2025 family protein n=1 Tax=unclassified Pseudomonas TaxID=196821 RepID=UPI002AC98AC7|nr:MULTISPECIES: DUF2025 family protein [unclassified Pseudomonas]MEB0042666.1 DUF2025 family protein [Pseudomonas sp. MH10]MEB0123933.1 DUF2025 family protein [Pseudomonas sp. CCI1.2]WPX63511.1 DUF2025 family protein [Pseudomonas sp. MH10]
MSITSSTICDAADLLKGFVGYHHKANRYIVRFSEDSFGMDVADDSITPTNEFVWRSGDGQLMTLKRESVQLLLEQNIDDRLNITEPLRIYVRRVDLPEITAMRQLKRTDYAA